MCKTSVSKEKQIEYIMAHFDFEKVHKVMTLLDWQWLGPKGYGEVPSIEWIKKAARRRLERSKENQTLRGGGFCVANHGGNLMLSFEVAWELGEWAKYYKGDLTP